MEALTFKPEEWGMKRGTDNEDFMFSTSVRTTHRRMVRSALFCNWTAKRSSTAYRISVITTAAPRRWASVSPAQLHPVYRPY